MKSKEKKPIKDILLNEKKDRRILENVPDKEGIRKENDRRGKNIVDKYKNKEQAFVKGNKVGTRYITEVDVKVKCKTKVDEVEFIAKSRDISITGILIKLEDKKDLEAINEAKNIKLVFKVLPGSMPEGYEMKVRVKGRKIREVINDGEILCGIEFLENLSEYSLKNKGRYALALSSITLFLISLFIILMRAESIVYFKFNRILYLYSIIAAIFLLSRYIFGALYRPLPVDFKYTPGVSIIVPCFNEEKWIQKTILGCINQNYPLDKLEVIVVDDSSDDKSVEKIKEIVDELGKNDKFDVKTRLKYYVQPNNLGKREALCTGVINAKHELVVFVDSDSFLDPYAIINLVQPFKDPKVGGVSGRTDVANTFTNLLTKMQSVRYYIAFRIMKAAEGYFDAVTCLSGPLSCYKKDIVLENMEEWRNQKFLGHRATFGDDRSMTNLILRNHRTTYQDTAICKTIVPNDYKIFLKQQMRWKRSWLRESIIAGKFMWKKEPFMAMFFYTGLLVPILAPVVVVYNLFYVPLIHKIFPTTFLIGLLMMALMMSFTQMFFRKSTTWIFGLVFCLFYEAVLLWQMPIAWVTFWKSTWGTRMTPSDIEAERRKLNIKNRTSGGIRNEV